MTCFNDNIWDKLSGKESKLLSSFIFLLFKNVATRKHKRVPWPLARSGPGAAPAAAASDGE